MSRRHAAKKRVVLPDLKYNSVLLAKFINGIMREGKKALAEKIVYGAFGKIESKYKLDAYEIFTTAMNNVKPFVEVQSVRVGGANYQVPSRVSEERGYALAAVWVKEAAGKRSGKRMIEKLAEELFEASNNKGAAIKKREDTHKMAESNKAFSHLSPKKTAEGR